MKIMEFKRILIRKKVKLEIIRFSEIKLMNQMNNKMHIFVIILNHSYLSNQYLIFLNSRERSKC
jgi:hypothetical protein